MASTTTRAEWMRLAARFTAAQANTLAALGADVREVDVRWTDAGPVGTVRAVMPKPAEFITLSLDLDGKNLDQVRSCIAPISRRARDESVSALPVVVSNGEKFGE